MKHRVFVAINLPENIKESLSNYRESHQDVPAKWTARENLHITLAFIGDVEDNKLSELHRAIADAVKERETFFMSLNNINYDSFNGSSTPLSGETGTLSVPRMIWAVGDSSRELTLLKKDLVEAILKLPIAFASEKKEIIPHITLARIKEWEWRRVEPEERPEVGENIDFCFEVKSIDLMESFLKRTGVEYKILESYKLTP